MSNALVAGPVDLSTPFSGAFILEDGEMLAGAIKRGDWLEGGMAAFSLVADGIAAVLDPLGSLIAAGLGWLMEHIEPLKGWLNDLTGDAGEVAGFAQTWTNISVQLRSSGEDLLRVIGDVDAEEGETIAAYRRFQTDAAKHIQAAGTWADAMSSGMQIASTIVKIVHDVVRDAIAQVVGSLISYAITLAASLGTATPLVIAQATSRVASVSARVGQVITRVIKAIGELIPLVKRLSQMFTKLENAVAPMLPGFRGGDDVVPPSAPRHPEADNPNVAPWIVDGVDTRPYLDGSRPSFRQDTVPDTWQNAVDASPDGVVRDPNPPYEVIDWTPGEPRAGIWDMGHDPQNRYSVMLERYRNGEMTPQEFRDWYNDPAHYRPETPSNNRSNRYSDG